MKASVSARLLRSHAAPVPAMPGQQPALAGPSSGPAQEQRAEKRAPDPLGRQRSFTSFRCVGR